MRREAKAASAWAPHAEVATTLGDVMVRSLVPVLFPDVYGKLKMPNSCNTFRTDKSVKWALDELRKWPEGSPPGRL
jgi:hypothetical protein